TSDQVHLDGPARRRLAADLAVAVLARRPQPRERLGYALFALRERGLEVLPAVGEQAGVEMAVGGDAGAMAIAAERRADRADETDLASAISEGVAPRHFAGVVRGQRAQRPARGDALAQFLGAHHLGRIPAVAGPHVHVFDEAHHVAGAAEALQQRQHLVLV